jgi:ElaB/YqjD/DUF883 family membrane-anchored ribosome-binding protein
MEGQFMESATNNHGSEQAGGTRPGAAHDAASAERADLRQQVERLIADVDELAGRIGNAADPEVARLRAKLEGALERTRTLIAQRRAAVQRQARDAFVAGDRYVHDQSWRVIGAATVTALAVGFLLGRRDGLRGAI